MIALSLNALPSVAETSAQKRLKRIQSLQKKREEEKTANAFTAYRVAYKDYSVYGVGWD